MTTEQIVSAAFETEEDVLRDLAGLEPSGESIRVIGLRDEMPIVQAKGNAAAVRRLLSYAVYCLMEKGAEAGQGPEEVKRWAKQIAQDAVRIFEDPEGLTG